MKTVQKPNLLRLVTVCVLMVLLASCSDSTWEYTADNPLDTDISFTIDGKEYTIPAGGSIQIGLTQGRHSLTYNGSTANFVTKVMVNKGESILNPTLSNYIVHNYIYVKSQNINVEDTYMENSYEYPTNEGIVRWPARVLNTLVFDRGVEDWNFGLEREASENVGVRSAGSSDIVFPKIYREADYLKKYADELPVGLVFSKNDHKLNEQAVYEFPKEALYTDCESWNDWMDRLAERMSRYLSDPSNAFHDINGVQFDILNEHRNYRRECNPDNTNEQMNKASEKLFQEAKILGESSTFIVR